MDFRAVASARGRDAAGIHDVDVGGVARTHRLEAAAFVHERSDRLGVVLVEPAPKGAECDSSGHAARFLIDRPSDSLRGSAVRRADTVVTGCTPGIAGATKRPDVNIVRHSRARWNPVVLGKPAPLTMFSPRSRGRTVPGAASTRPATRANPAQREAADWSTRSQSPRAHRLRTRGGRVPVPTVESRAPEIASSGNAPARAPYASRLRRRHEIEPRPP